MTGKLLRVDMSTLTWTAEELPEAYRSFGGRGLTSSIVEREVAPGCDALGNGNKLVFAPGLLAATRVPNSGRLSVGAKSPLTGTIKEANAGGAAARKLARLGIRALVIEGRARELTTIKINKKGVQFLTASALSGMGNYELVEGVRGEHGDRCAFISIGPAGEKQMAAASITVTSPDFHLRVAARGGLGAVMGARNLKSIVIDDRGGKAIEARDRRKLKEAVNAMSKGIRANPLAQALNEFGTPALVMLANTVGALPTRNFSAGQFEGAERICGEYLIDVMKKRPNSQSGHRCMEGCIVGCSNIYTDERGETIVSGIDYETIALVGSNCMIGDLDTIARISRACRDVGVDTIEVGGAIGVAMEAGLLPWGDGEGTLGLVREIGEGTEKGRMIGSGCRFTGARLGVKRVPHVKGQCLSGYDPRILKGTGVTYATSPMGADHTAGIVLPGPSDPDYNPIAPLGQGVKSEFMQTYMAAVDSLGLCMMAAMPLVEAAGLHLHLISALAAVTGEQLGQDYLTELGRSVLRMERKFNAAAGFTEKDDRLPGFFAEESLSPDGPVFDVPDEELDGVNRF